MIKLSKGIVVEDVVEEVVEDEEVEDVEEAGGVIEVDSTVGQGTTFTVRLVAGSAEATSDSAATSAAERDVA